MRQLIFNYYVNDFGTYLFISKRVFMVYFGVKEKNAVTLTHIAQRKHELSWEIKEMSKTRKLPSREKIAL